MGPYPPRGDARQHEKKKRQAEKGQKMFLATCEHSLTRIRSVRKKKQPLQPVTSSRVEALAVGERAAYYLSPREGARAARRRALRIESLPKLRWRTSSARGGASPEQPKFFRTSSARGGASSERTSPVRFRLQPASNCEQPKRAAPAATA